MILLEHLRGDGHGRIGHKLGQVTLPTAPTGYLYMVYGSNDMQVPVENTLYFAELMHI